MQYYDLIGDVHGHADELVRLLEHLGYRDSGTGYRHDTRKMIFLGDFIDRGEHLAQHQKLLGIVMPMVQNGHALAVMGNHEFNALAYHTQHEGEFLRPHTDKNTEQHQAFLNEFEDEPELKQSVLDFFYSLPLWLELDGIRVVHACWDQSHINVLKELTPSQKLDHNLLVEASREGSPAYEAVETLLKGVEFELPNGISFKDNNGHSRTAVRIKWWDNQSDRLGDVALPDGVDIGEAADQPIPSEMPIYGTENPPCFIGHYWLSGRPEPLTDNVACLDYSIAKNGKLVAYRWGGEKTLKAENFTHA